MTIGMTAAAAPTYDDDASVVGHDGASAEEL